MVPSEADAVVLHNKVMVMAILILTLIVRVIVIVILILIVKVIYIVVMIIIISADPSSVIGCTHGWFLTRRQRGHPDVVVPLVISNSANHSDRMQLRRIEPNQKRAQVEMNSIGNEPCVAENSWLAARLVVL